MSGDHLPPPPAIQVIAHPSLCVGWANCTRWAPDVYHLGDDGHIDIHRVEVPSDQAEDAWWGAQICPERALTVIGPPDQYWLDRKRSS